MRALREYLRANNHYCQRWGKLALQRVMITAAQIRAARAMLEWTREQLAKASGVSHSAIADFEKGRNASMLTETARKLIDAFSDAGVEFTDATKQHGAGVRWKVSQ